MAEEHDTETFYDTPEYAEAYAAYDATQFHEANWVDYGDQSHYQPQPRYGSGGKYSRGGGKPKGSGGRGLHKGGRGVYVPPQGGGSHRARGNTPPRRASQPSPAARLGVRKPYCGQAWNRSWHLQHPAPLRGTHLHASGDGAAEGDVGRRCTSWNGSTTTFAIAAALRAACSIGTAGTKCWSCSDRRASSRG